MNRATDHLGTAKADGSGLGRLVHKCVRERCRPNLLTYNFNPLLFWIQNYVVGFYVVSCRYAVC